MLPTLTDEMARQSFSYPWTKGQAVSFLEVQIYILRHSQEHAAQLNIFLGQHGVEGAPDWISRVSTDAGSQALSPQSPLRSSSPANRIDSPGKE
jgi:hypothetical protein